MVKISTIFILGIVIALAQFLGLPMSWKNLIYGISGVLIAVLSFLIRKELHEVLRQLHSDEVKTNTFSENSPRQEKEV